MVERTPAVTNLQGISETVCDHITQGHLPGVCLCKRFGGGGGAIKAKGSNICGSHSQTRDAYCSRTLVVSILYNTGPLDLFHFPNDLPKLITEVTEHTDVATGQISHRLVCLHLYSQSVL